MTIRRGFAAVIFFCSAVQAQTACKGPSAYGDIGVRTFQCVRANCTIAGRGNTDSAHVFNVEPTMWYIDVAVRAQIMDGDALVAVDGIPITTSAGGARLASLRPGVKTTLLVRRGGREIPLTITTIPWCDRPGIQITSTNGGPPLEVSRLLVSPLILRALVDSLHARDQRLLQLQLEMLGLKTSPVVDSIVPGSAAAGLGLRAGDIIVAIEELPRRGPPASGSLEYRITYRRQGVLGELLLAINPPKR